MKQTFFFYDLETSGLKASESRIMQFAGIRTDLDFNQIGEPVNDLIRLNEDTLPSPSASLVTGITPQQTVMDGYSEAEFAKKLTDEIFTPGTIVVGFNNIRFDDEFIRYFLWRNFHDPYEWAYAENRSRWDMLDVVRMVRALRPEGIEWPVVNGKATNRLELLTKVNGIEHYKAHDALSDVYALIAVAKLIKEKQPKMFDYLFSMRNKLKIKDLINVQKPVPFVYTSGRYDEEFNKTTIALPLCETRPGTIAVVDLRYNPDNFVNMSLDELKMSLFAKYEDRQKDDFVKVPVKEFQYNRCPAVAPLGVLNQNDGWDKIKINPEDVQENYNKILKNKSFIENIKKIYDSRPEFEKSKDAEGQLYDGFLGESDKKHVEAVRNSSERELASFTPDFKDNRLSGLFLNYKARNFPKTLSESEIQSWEKWRSNHIKKQLPSFMKELSELSKKDLDDNKRFVLEELQLWLESIIPTED